MVPAFAGRPTRAIMGGGIPAAERRPPLAEGAEVVLELRGVTLGARLAGIDLTIRAGEIVGVAGVEGNGQHELARVLGGLAPIDGGTIELAGMTELLRDSASPAARVRAARRQGLVVVHDDRHKDELVLDATVADNLVLGDLPLADEAAARDRRFERFAVAPADPWRRAGELSGGNQQKVVMARALDRKLAALVLAQPTRGVDVGTARTIHAAIAAAAEKGAAVLVISADLNELRALCHRIVVLRRGAIVAELEPTASDETIGRAMLASS